jgi:LysM domain
MRANTICGPGPAGPFVPSPSGSFIRSVGSPAVTSRSSTYSPVAWGEPRRSSEQAVDAPRRRLVGALVLAAAVVIVVALAMLAGSGAEPAAAAGAVPAAVTEPSDAASNVLSHAASNVLSHAASDVLSDAASDIATHVVRVGDTMWAIADLYRGPIAHDDYLAALLARNGGADLRVGQLVILP